MTAKVVIRELLVDGLRSPRSQDLQEQLPIPVDLRVTGVDTMSCGLWCIPFLSWLLQRFHAAHGAEEQRGIVRRILLRRRRCPS